MSGFNQVILLGHLGRDPEIRYTQSGTPVCRLAVATSRSWKDDGGEKHEETEWHRVVVWGATAKNCADFLTKGRQVHVEGRLRTQKWTDKDGVDRYSTEIVANGVQFVGSGSSQREGTQNHNSNSNPPPNGGTQQSSGAGAGGPKPGPQPGEDDDIPF